MNLFSWIWGSSGKKIELNGSFIMFNPLYTPKTIFVSCTLSIDEDKKVDGENFIEITNLLETEEDEKAQYTFAIDESRQFSRVKNADGHYAFCWRGEDEEFNTWFIFKLSEGGNVQANAKLLETAVCDLIFEASYNQKPTDDDDPTKLCGEATFPFNLDTLEFIKKMSPKQPLKKESPTKTPPKETLVSPKKSPNVVVHSSIYPDLEKVEPTIEQTREDEEECVSALCDLYLLVPETNVFEEKRRDVIARIIQMGDWKDCTYKLVVEHDEKIIVAQLINSEMQMQAYEKHHSIIWIAGKYTLSLVFKDRQEEVEFKKQFTECLYESASLSPFNKLKEEDQKMLYNTILLDEDVEMEDVEFEKDDLMDFLSDEEEVEEDDEEEWGEEEEDIKTPSPKKRVSHSDVKNKLLADSYKHGRTFIVRGSNIGVFKKDYDDVIYKTTIKDVSTLNGNKFTPSKVMLHEQDNSMLLLHPNQNNDLYTGRVYKMDLERGKVVEEWKAWDNILKVEDIVPISKYAQQTPTSTFAALNNATIFAMDPRINNENKVVGNVLEYQSKSKPGYSCLSTTQNGNVAIGSTKGEIRLYSGVPGLSKASGKGKNPKNAKTLLPGFGDPIRGIDVTGDGKWVLATCKTYLLIIPTTIPDTDITGFEKPMGKKKPNPKRLQLLPNDVLLLDGEVDFTPARFNTGCDGEIWIVTSSDDYLISWNFKKVQQNVLNCYTMKKLPGRIVVDQFVNVPLDTPGRDAPVVVALEDDVRLEKRVYKNKIPYKNKPKYK